MGCELALGSCKGGGTFLDLGLMDELGNHKGFVEAFCISGQQSPDRGDSARVDLRIGSLKAL